MNATLQQQNFYENNGKFLNLNQIGANVHGGSPTAFFSATQLMQGLINNSKMIIEKTSTSPLNDRSILISSNVNPSPFSYNQLHQAACVGNSITIRNFLETADLSEINQIDRHGNTPLHWAVSENQAEIVSTLVENGADVNVQNFAGETPIFIVAARGNVQVCSELLQGGANVNLTNLAGSFPVHIAAANGNLEVLKLLLKFGAFVFAQDDEGDSMLHYAVRESQFEIVSFLLINFPALLQLKNEDDESPFELAASIQDFQMMNMLRV